MDIQFRWIIFILLAVSKQLLFLISCPFFTLKHGPFSEELLQKIVCCCGLALQCLGAKYTNGVKISKIYNKLISDLQGMGLCICIEFLLLFKKYSISSSKVLYAHKLQFQLVKLLDIFSPIFFITTCLFCDIHICLEIESVWWSILVDTHLMLLFLNRSWPRMAFQWGNIKESKWRHL